MKGWLLIICCFTIHCVALQENNQQGFAYSDTLVDTSAPIFAGLISVANSSTNTATLVWIPGTDNKTIVMNLKYNIYWATASGAENYSASAQAVADGLNVDANNQIKVAVSITSDASYFFVVRAQDEAGNTESNTLEKSALIQ